MTETTDPIEAAIEYANGLSDAYSGNIYYDSKIVKIDVKHRPSSREATFTITRDDLDSAPNGELIRAIDQLVSEVQPPSD